MDNKNNKVVKRNFIDDIFGENIEYVRIYSKDGIIIIFDIDNKIYIKNFKNIKEIIESFISKCMENKFYNDLLDEQDVEINTLNKKVYQLENKEDGIYATKYKKIK